MNNRQYDIYIACDDHISIVRYYEEIEGRRKIKGISYPDVSSSFLEYDHIGFRHILVGKIERLSQKSDGILFVYPKPGPKISNCEHGGACPQGQIVNAIRIARDSSPLPLNKYIEIGLNCSASLFRPGSLSHCDRSNEVKKLIKEYDICHWMEKGTIENVIPNQMKPRNSDESSYKSSDVSKEILTAIQDMRREMGAIADDLHILVDILNKK